MLLLGCALIRTCRRTHLLGHSMRCHGHAWCSDTFILSSSIKLSACIYLLYTGTGLRWYVPSSTAHILQVHTGVYDIGIIHTLLPKCHTLMLPSTSHDSCPGSAMTRVHDCTSRISWYFSVPFTCGGDACTQRCFVSNTRLILANVLQSPPPS